MINLKAAIYNVKENIAIKEIEIAGNSQNDFDVIIKY